MSFFSEVGIAKYFPSGMRTTMSVAYSFAILLPPLLLTGLRRVRVPTRCHTGWRLTARMLLRQHPLPGSCLSWRLRNNAQRNLESFLSQAWCLLPSSTSNVWMYYRNHARIRPQVRSRPKPQIGSLVRLNGGSSTRRVRQWRSLVWRGEVNSFGWVFRVVSSRRGGHRPTRRRGQSSPSRCRRRPVEREAVSPEATTRQSIAQLAPQAHVPGPHAVAEKSATCCGMNT